MRQRALFFVNGKKVEVGPQDGKRMLSDFLRQKEGLTGTKIVCAEGDCGACSVLVCRDPTEKIPKFFPINSCIALTAQLDGAHIITVEGLKFGDQLAPVQTALYQSHASQCGFCTPGFAIALTGLVEKRLCAKRLESIQPQEAKNATTGNLCRCTGYQPIVDAACSIPLSQCKPLAKRYSLSAEQKKIIRSSRNALRIEDEEFLFFSPTKPAEAVRFLRAHKDARVLGAGTDLGVMVNKRKLRFKAVLSLHLIDGLNQIRTKKTKDGARMFVGARVSLTELRDAIKERVPELVRYLDLFASPQIKNSATLVGNVANASPIAEMPPFLLVNQARVFIIGPKGRRIIPIEKFFISYKKTSLRSGEWIEGIDFRLPEKKEKLFLYKISERKDLDISAVNAAFWISGFGEKVQLRLALGGVAAVPKRCFQTEKVLQKVGLGEEGTLGFKKVIQTLQTEVTPIDDVRGSASP